MSRTTRNIALFAAILPLVVIIAAGACAGQPAYYDNVKRVFPAVVRVVTADKMGSGVIVSKTGYVLTSQHVVDKNKTATVQLFDGSKYQGAVAAADESKDLAVIKLPENAAGYPFATTGSSTESDTLQTSSPVLIIGYPVENEIGKLSLTTGIICAFPRMQSVSYLQTDAKVFPASSGGPMTDSKGDVIGIINSQYTNMEGHCSTFATAIGEAKSLLDQAAQGLPSATQPAAAQTSPPAAQPATTPVSCVEVGCLAPDFTLSTPDGKAISLSSLKGKKVILAFVSTRCSTCLEVSICTQQFYGNWPREQMEIVSIVSQEKAADVTSWIKTYGIKNPVVLDPNGDIYNKYRPEKVPSLYFLNGDGIIKIKKFGAIDDCTTELDSLLRLYEVR